VTSNNLFEATANERGNNELIQSLKARPLLPKIDSDPTSPPLTNKRDPSASKTKHEPTESTVSIIPAVIGSRPEITENEQENGAEANRSWPPLHSVPKSPVESNRRDLSVGPVKSEPLKTAVLIICVFTANASEMVGTGTGVIAGIDELVSVGVGLRELVRVRVGVGELVRVRVGVGERVRVRVWVGELVRVRVVLGERVLVRVGILDLVRETHIGGMKSPAFVSGSWSTQSTVANGVVPFVSKSNVSKRQLRKVKGKPMTK
jgi:hypothetical protein